ncbi:MAG: HEAT repeat domain-containing protein [Phycisphaerae bacterium]|nr:HEAT repeat domain-containing protein [Phycisphaerae bacterium]
MMKEFHRKILKNRGIQDLSPASLTGLLCSQSVLLRYHSASLLGEEQERSAIPALEQLLTDQQPIVRLAATRALLRMDNRGGIPMLEAFCKRVAEEIKNGEYRNLSDGLSALRVLAEAQEASAIPLLRSLLGAPVFSDDYYYFVRLEVVRSLGRLMAKDPSVEVDIMQMLGDEHPVVSKEAALILKKVRAAEQ